MSMKRLGMWILAYMLLLAGTSTIFAADEVRIPWQVENVGTFYVPDGWQAAKIDLTKELNGKKTADILKEAAADTPNMQVNPSGKLDTLDIQAYQVTLHDGTAHHLAWLLFMKDTKKMTAQQRDFFARDVSEDLKQQARRLVSDINAKTAQYSFEDPKTKVGFKLVEMIPVEFLEMNRRQALASGGRGLITSEDLVFPLFVKGYIFDTKGHFTLAALVTLDGERVFWEPVLRRVMFSLNRR